MAQVLSIDIGVRNLALWIEEFNKDKLKEFKQSLSKIEFIFSYIMKYIIKDSLRLYK